MAYQPAASIEASVKNLIQLEDLQDIDISGLNINDILLWKGSSWFPISNSLNNLEDVVFTNLKGNQALIYDANNSQWINGDITNRITDGDITSVTFLSNDYAVGETINITVTFSGSVIVIDNPQINTTADSGTILFDFANQPASNVVVFEYVVQIGDSELASLGINFIDFTNGNIRNVILSEIPINVPKFSGITIGSIAPARNDWYNTSGTVNATIISFSNSNQISLNGSLLTTLNEGQTSFQASVSLGDRISSTGGICVWGDNGLTPPNGNFTTSTWLPTNMTGREFVQWIERNDPQTLGLTAFATPAVVQIFTNGVLLRTVNVPANTTVQESLSGVSNSVLSWFSDEDILSQITANFRDSRPIFPASFGPLYGVPSVSADIVSYGSGNVDLLTSQNTPSTSIVSPSRSINVSGANLYDGDAYKVTANTPIGVSSVADSNGGETTTWIPTSMMGTTFFIPRECNYVVFISEQPGVRIEYFDPSDYTTPILAFFTGGSSIIDVPNIFKFDPIGTVPVGAKFVSDALVAVIAEDTNDGDETNLFGDR